jgi:hypothetical protein
MVTEFRLKAILLAGLAISAAPALIAWRDGAAFAGWMFWLVWPAMTLHQCEENIFTEHALGPKYGFLRWAARMGYEISPARALALNVGVGWTLAIASGLVGSRFVYFPLFVIAVEAVNAFWHLSVTAHAQRWSPGTLSSALVTIPLAAVLFHTSASLGLAGSWGCLAVFLLAAISHHVFLGSLPRSTNRPG